VEVVLLRDHHDHSGVEGHDSCHLLLKNATTSMRYLLDFWRAQQDCESRGGHLLTTSAVSHGQDSLLNAAINAYPGAVFYIGGFRCD
jgi:hypothetical protein